MTPQAKRLYALIRTVRGSFNRLKQVAEAKHRDLGITASMRGVMETLAEEGPAPVPQIARGKGVSRQHIQVTVDALLQARLVELLENPAHRRSPLVGLTPGGGAAFHEIRRREVRELEALAEGLDSAELDAASRLLSLLSTRLDGIASGAPGND